VTISSTSEQVWWKEPLERTELLWIVIALLWCLVMFFMMPYWHIYGQCARACRAGTRLRMLPVRG
jgi:cytochrome c oxidase subunit 2